MVAEQLLSRGIRDKNVLGVFRKVPRHIFLDPESQKDAYADSPVSIGNGQTISQPYIVALMVQLADIVKSDKILEIGTGSGYETAIVAELGGSVFSVERVPLLAAKARRVLEKEGYENIKIKVGDGTLGWQEFAPFDKIVVTASSSDIPQPFLDQLCVGGRLVIPVGSRFSQTLTVVERQKKDKFLKKEICGCVFVPLIGKYGWEDESARKNS